MSLHKNMFCAPGNTGGGGGSCFDREGLLRIIKNYNKRYPNNKIIFKKNITDHALWKLIRDGLANICQDREYCWLDQDFLQDDYILQNYYKPPIPSKPKQWLSTSDIDSVLKQYEKQFPRFMFMGTVPIDFDEVITEYKNIDICSLYNNKQITQYGFVFNLDPHDRRGSHWVSMFLNLTQPEYFIGFFDSYGSPPPKQIVKLIQRLRDQVHNCLGVNLKYKCNTIQHQHQSTECGVYSLYFIYRCLQGHSFELITENIILDNDINKFRQFFFRPTIYYKS